MNVRRWSNAAICLIVAAVVYLMFGLFTLEVLALGWHARYGWTAEIRSQKGDKYEIRVPTLAWAQVDENGSEVSIIERTTPARAYFSQAEFAMMTFTVDRDVPTAEKMRALSALAKHRMEISITDVQSISIAGEELHCFEQKIQSRKARELYAGVSLVDLTCAPQGDKKGFAATYAGTRGLVPRFFDVLKTVKRNDK